MSSQTSKTLLGRVISGLDHGLASMKRGEVATLYIGPPNAYGDSGYLDVIAPGETLVVEMTLFDWRGSCCWSVTFFVTSLTSHVMFSDVYELRGADE